MQDINAEPFRPEGAVLKGEFPAGIECGCLWISEKRIVSNQAQGHSGLITLLNLLDIQHSVDSTTADPLAGAGAARIAASVVGNVLVFNKLEIFSP